MEDRRKGDPVPDQFELTLKQGLLLWRLENRKIGKARSYLV